MKSGGKMVRVKDTITAYGVILICFCIVFLEMLFLSYNVDLNKLDTSLFDKAALELYDAQLQMCMMMHIISFCVLGIFGIILLFFSVERYIENNKQNMGVLKALGYSNFEISKGLVKFAIPTFVGCLLGFLGALIFANQFYASMNDSSVYLDFKFSFNVWIAIGLVLIPPILMGIFSVLVGLLKLREEPLQMINGISNNKKAKAASEKNNYLHQLRNTIIINHKLLVIFEAFAVLCFSATIQMAFTMLNQTDTSIIFFLMMFIIGIILGVAILYLSFKFIYKSNFKYLSILKAYGYSDKECRYAIYSGYHYVSIVGFIIGTIYQVVLMMIMFNAFYSSFHIEYHFDFLAFLYSILIFLAFYFAFLIGYVLKIKKIKLDQININID